MLYGKRGILKLQTQLSLGKKNQTTYFALYHEKLGFDEKKHTATLLKYNIKILDLDNLGSESVTHENNL